MDILKINGNVVAVDEKTAIGINSQSYNISNPAEKLVNYTDSFSVPAVPETCNIFGFANSLSSTDTEVYEEFRSDYISEGLEIISNGKVYVDEIQFNKDEIDRFNLIAVSKNSIWDDLKDISYADFLDEFLLWASLPPAGSYSDIISMLATGNYDIRMVNYVGILADELNAAGTEYIEKDDIFYIGYEQGGVVYSGGHFAVSCKTIFRFIEHKFGINFNTGSTFQYNLFTDPFAGSLMIPVREISIIPAPVTFDFNCHPSVSGATQYVSINKSGTVTSISVDMSSIPASVLYVSIQTTSTVGQTGPVVFNEHFTLADNVKTCNFSTTGVNYLRVTSSTDVEAVVPTKLYYSDSGLFKISKNNNISTKEDVANFENLTLYDIVSSYMTIFNVLKVEAGTDIKMYRFDDIENLQAESFPGWFVSKTKKKTSIEGISQKNEIKYSSVYETGYSLLAGFIASSSNKSLPKTGEYLTIKGYVPAYRNGTIVLSYGSDGGALKEPCFFIPINTTSSRTVKCFFNDAYMDTTLSLNDCAVYSLNSEFALTKKIINKPCMWTGKFLINPYQYSQIKFFAKYRIPQFGCDCILISIAGYNPSKNTEPIECTFIKIPN